MKKAEKITIYKITFIGFLTICLSIIFLYESGQPSFAVENVPSDEADKLYRIFDVGNVHAHYIVAIDTSLSMKDSFSNVKDGLSALTGSFKKGDTISIITFDNDPEVIYQGKIKGTMDDFVKELPKSPSKDGKNTDIGKALGSVTRQIKESDEELQIVFFLTDGLDEPPDSSPYKKKAKTSWAKLRAQTKSIKGKDIKVHGIGLNDNTDIDLLKSIFPGTAQLTLSPEKLKKYFTTLKDEIREVKLRTELDKELRDGRVTMTPLKIGDWGEVESEGRIERDYKITSRYKHLSTQLTLSDPKILNLESSAKKNYKDYTVRLKGAGEYRLNPGESKVVTVQLLSPEFKRSKKIGSVKDVYDGELDFTIKAILQPESALESFGEDPKASFSVKRPNITFYRMDGLPVTTAIIYLLAAMVFSGVLVRTFFYPVGKRIKKSVMLPPLPGRLAFSSAPKDQNLPGSITLSSLGKSAVIGRTGDIVLKGAGIEDSHAELLSRWIDGRPAIVIRRIDGEVRVSKSSLEMGKSIADEQELRNGDIIMIDGYKIQWL